MQEKVNSFELIESRDTIDLVPHWEPQVWWYFAAAGLVIVIVLLVMVLGRKRAVGDAHKEKREAYIEAKKDFEKTQAVGVRETAVRVSVILRRYLARSMQEPALYESHEEFVSRHDALKDLPEDVRQSVAVFFARLAELKYAPEPPLAEPPQIHTGGLELLERIHAA
jgi:heme exporter protein D